MISAGARVTWLEWAGIVGISTAAGAAVGLATFWATTPGLPLRAISVIVPAALIVAFVFALVASVPSAILLILLARSSGSASTLRCALIGAAGGALIGALHPIVVVLAAVEIAASAPLEARVLSLAPIVAISGAIAGAFIVPRYVPKVRARISVVH